MNVREMGAPGTAGQLIQRTWTQRHLAGACIGGVAWWWGLSLNTSSTPVLELLPILAFGVTVIHLALAFRRVSALPTWLTRVTITDPRDGQITKESIDNPVGTLSRLAPAGWTVQELDAIRGDVHLLVQTPRRWGVRVHRGPLDLTGTPDDVFDRHRPLLAGTKNWGRRENMQGVVLWLPHGSTSVTLDARCLVVGGNASTVIAALTPTPARTPAPATRAPADTGSPSPRPERQARPRRTDSPSTVPVLSGRDLEHQLAALAAALPGGWRLVEDVALYGDVTLDAVLLTGDHVPIGVQVHHPATGAEAAGRVSAHMQRLILNSGLQTVAWIPSTSAQIPDDEQLVVFGTHDDLIRHLGGVPSTGGVAA